jgi:hypothetical protein
MLTFLANHQWDEAPSIRDDNRNRKMHHKEILSTSQRILEERHNEYGDASASFVRIASLSSLLLNKTITTYDVSVIMMAVKMSRLVNNKTHKDSWVDLINYTAFAGQFSEDKVAEIVEMTRLKEVENNLADQIKK